MGSRTITASEAVIFLTRDSGDGPAPEPEQVQVDPGNNPAAGGNNGQGGNSGQGGNNAQRGGGPNVDPQAFWEKYLKDIDVTGDMGLDDPACSRARCSAWRRKNLGQALAGFLRYAKWQLRLRSQPYF